MTKFYSFCILSILVVVSCSSVNLSEEEAKRLISEANGYPKLIATNFSKIRFNTPLYMEIQRLEREGYLEKKYKRENNERPRPQIAGKRQHLIITDKGKKLIEFIEYEILLGYTFAPITHERKIKRITEIEGKIDTVDVKYEVGYFSTEYFSHLMRIDRERMEEVTENLRVDKMQARLKKTDQGWKVIENTIVSTGS